MKIFILEDNSARNAWFREKLLTDFSVYMAVDVIEAKTIHEKHGPFDYYFLDHDLGDEVYVDSEYWNTGAQFSKWLVEHGVTGENEMVIVHSMNQNGSEYMVNMFSKAQHIPFPILKTSLNLT